MVMMYLLLDISVEIC